jgi:DMSO/TMAO reductase YedYZ molybdopterin-dependent catalytic subunit
MNHRLRVLTVCVIALVLGRATVAAAQEAGRSLMVTGDVAQNLTLTAADLKKMSRASVSLKTFGMEHVYEGVSLGDVLKRAGVPLGPELRGKALSTYVIAEGLDGYQILFSLGELDSEITSNRYLLADTINGKPLPEGEGPFRIVIPEDKVGARSIRTLVRLRVVQLRK